MTTDQIITLTGIVFSGIVGYSIKYFFDKKAQFASKNSEIKREMYQEYVEFIFLSLDNLKGQANGATAEQTKDMVSKLKEFHRKAVLYSSPKVINAFSDMMQHSYKFANDKSKSLHYMVLMTNVFKAMRKDIGLSNRGLKSGAIRLLRPLINDYDTTIRPIEISMLLNARNQILYSKNEAKK